MTPESALRGGGLGSCSGAARGRTLCQLRLYSVRFSLYAAYSCVFLGVFLRPPWVVAFW